MPYSDDPIRDFERYDSGQARELRRLPVCAECGEPIQDEHCFEINDELICEQCLNQNHRKYVDDYIL
jgi:formylmethanofuran dehydrogenase subunit E